MKGKIQWEAKNIKIHPKNKYKASIKEIEITVKIFKKWNHFTGQFYYIYKKKNCNGKELFNSLYQDEIIIIPKSDNDYTKKENYTSIYLINTDTKILKNISMSHSTMYHNQVGFILGI